MLTAIQLNTVLKLQDGMNAKINPNWVSAGSDWLLAILVESTEAIEHNGWKWWKKQTPNMPQLQVEIVDVLHFVASDLLVKNGGDREKTAAAVMSEIEANKTGVMFDGKLYTLSSMSLLDKLNLMAGLAAAKRFDTTLFMGILNDCGMSGDELYRQYVGKNVLNFFRQANSYKEGNYTKIWNGREDNEHLVDIMNSLDINSPTFSDDVYAGLESLYPGDTLQMSM